MSLAPGEQQRLTEIEDQLRRSDSGLAAMFARFPAGAKRARPALMQLRGCSPGRAGRVRMIILIALGAALFIACIVVALSMASHVSQLQGGYSPGTNPASISYSGRLFFRQVILGLTGHLQQAVQRLGEVVQLREVGRGEVLHQLVAFVREVYAHHAAVFLVLLATDDTNGLSPVDEAHGAVALQHQIFGKIPDGRRLRTTVPLDRHQQLVLRWRQPRCDRLVLAPAHKAP